MQAIIDERAVEIEKVHKGIVEINEMFVDLSRIVQEQQVCQIVVILLHHDYNI